MRTRCRAAVLAQFTATTRLRVRARGRGARREQLGPLRPVGVDGDNACSILEAARSQQYGRHIKLNHFCPAILKFPWQTKSLAARSTSLPIPSTLTTDGICESFLRSALHTAHDLIHMFLLHERTTGDTEEHREDFKDVAPLEAGASS